MNYKRKRSHRQVRCTMCTSWSWLGNHSSRKPIQDEKQRQAALQDDPMHLVEEAAHERWCEKWGEVE